MATILVPTDYSQCSLSALKQAFSLIRGTADRMVILHVSVPQSNMSPMALDEQDHLYQDAMLLLQKFSDAQPELRIEQRRVDGIPVSTIVKTAIDENADMIVMGTTGRTGLKRALMGSVAEEVVRRAPCPVLTLKVPADSPTIPESDFAWESLTNLAQPLAAASSPSADAVTQMNDNPTLALISRGINARVSDIHIDPAGQEFVIRFRIDGQMQHFCRLSEQVGHSLITQLKVAANLNIAEPFHAQEGRIKLPESMSDYDVRITVVHVVEGEAISLRLLNRNRLVRPLEQLGLSPECQSRIDRILRHGEGLILVTGPTGSGKTTTLYSLLNALNDGRRHIVSIEDPVEYHIPAYRQMNVDPRHGITMTTGLKTILRLDPDVVLVGEIRDREAAETAMRAASSGKFVFSSLHTRDVASTVTALRDLQIDNRSLGGNLVGILSQRLIRRLCSDCNRLEAITEAEAAAFRNWGLEPPEQVRHPVGCPRCRGTGYYDRIGLFEVVIPEGGVLHAIETGEPEHAVREAIRSGGISNLEMEALKNVALGITSLEECYGVLSIRPEPSPVSTSCV